MATTPAGPADPGDTTPAAAAAEADLDGIFTAEELGDTMTPRNRWITRVAVIVVMLLGATAVLVAGTTSLLDTPPIAAGAGQATPGTPTAAPTTAATATSPATSPAVSPAAPSTPATVAPTRAASTIDPTLELDPSFVGQSRLVEAEDAALFSIALEGALGVPADRPTLVLVERAEPYSMDELIAIGAAQRIDPATVLLQQRVVVQRGATLVITLPGQTLRLASGTAGFTSIVTWGGNLVLAGSVASPLAVVGWDTAEDGPDRNETDGRAYVRVNGGAATIDSVNFASLGFWSGRTSGLSITGSTENPGHGSILNSAMDDLHIGTYLSAVNNVHLVGATITRSRQQGIEIGNESKSVFISNTLVDGSAKTGLNAQTGSSRVSLDSVTLSDNGGYGLRFDGGARADGPSTAGYSVENSTGLHVTGSRITNNRSGGISVIAADNVDIVSTVIDERSLALAVKGTAGHVSVIDSTITSANGDAINVVDGAVDVLLSGNTVSGSTNGIAVHGSQASIINNTLHVDLGRGILLAGPDISGMVTGNTITGTGPAAIGQVETYNNVAVDNNRYGDWLVRTDLIIWANRHPLAWLWAALLLIPVVGLLFIARRFRRQRKIRRLIESTTIAVALAEKAAYEAQWSESEEETADEVAANAAKKRYADLAKAAQDEAERRAAAGFSGIRQKLDDSAKVRVDGRRPTEKSAPARDLPPRDVPMRHPGRWTTNGPPAATTVPPATVTPRSPSSTRTAASPPGEPQPATRAPSSTRRPAQPPPETPRPPSTGTPRPIPENVPETRVKRDVSTAATAGQFSSVEQLAVKAVMEGGKPIAEVAATLRVSSAAVRHWVARARGEQP